MNSKRILITMIEPPLPMGNAAARWFYVLLNELVSRGHRVTALAACSKLEEIDATYELFNGKACELHLFPFPIRGGISAKIDSVRRPFSYMFSKEFVGKLEQCAREDFDVLHMEQLLCGWLAGRHRNKTLVNVHFLNAIDQETMNCNGIKQRLMRFVALHTERRLLRSFTYINALSPRLAEKIQTICPSANITSHPIGIDTSLYPFIPDELRTKHPTIGIIGNMNWYPSNSAAKRLLTELWPEIKRRVPNAKAQIVGWGARSALSEYLNLPDVEILENVPDARPYFESTGVMLYAPARGSGMKIKILEAFGYGVPVVTTQEGIEGIPALDEVHAGVCDDNRGLIERATKILRDVSLQNRIRLSARQLLETHCSPVRTVNLIESVYDRICAHSSGPSSFQARS